MIAIVYKSKTDFTKRYAKWINEKVKGEVIDFKDFSKKDMSSYDVVIYGGRVFAGQIDGLKEVKEKVKSKLIIFAVGATEMKDNKAIDKIWVDNLGDETDVPHFYMQGGLDYKKMGFLEKAMMKAVGKKLNKKGNGENDLTKSFDSSQKTYIEPLIKYLKDTKIL